MKKDELYESIQKKINFQSDDVDKVRESLNKIIAHQQKHLDQINNEYREIDRILQKDKFEGKLTEEEYKNKVSINTDNYNDRRTLFKEESRVPKEYYDSLQPFFDSENSLLMESENFKTKISLDDYPFVLLYKELFVYEKKVLNNDFRIEFVLSSNKNDISNLIISLQDNKRNEIYLKISMDLEAKLVLYIDTEQDINMSKSFIEKSNLGVLDILNLEKLIDIENTMSLTMDYNIKISESSLYPILQKSVTDFLKLETPEIKNINKINKNKI